MAPPVDLRAPPPSSGGRAVTALRHWLTPAAHDDSPPDGDGDAGDRIRDSGGLAVGRPPPSSWFLVAAVGGASACRRVNPRRGAVAADTVAGGRSVGWWPIGRRRRRRPQVPGARSATVGDVPRAPRVTGEEALRALRRAGWRETRRRGSHAILHHDVRGGRVTVPVHAGTILKPKTLQSILDQAGLDVEAFRGLL